MSVDRPTDQSNIYRAAVDHAELVKAYTHKKVSLPSDNPKLLALGSENDASTLALAKYFIDFIEDPKIAPMLVNEQLKIKKISSYGVDHNFFFLYTGIQISDSNYHAFLRVRHMNLTLLPNDWRNRIPALRLPENDQNQWKVESETATRRLFPEDFVIKSSEDDLPKAAMFDSFVVGLHKELVQLSIDRQILHTGTKEVKDLEQRVTSMRAALEILDKGKVKTSSK
jgi:hypothetical protein